MKLYKQFDCQNLHDINSQILTYIQSLQLPADQFWNPISTTDLIRACPELWSWLIKHNLPIKTVAVTQGTHANCCGPHIDTPPSIYKLSWPVLNAEYTWNRWFRPTPFARTSINPLGGTSYLESSDLTEIERMQVDRPAIIATGIPHDVWFAPGAKFPRWGLQCQLFNEPLEL